MKPLYLDAAASTPVRTDVVKAMLPYFTEVYGNPSSVHALGEKARTAIDGARASLARVIHAQPHEIIFTSGTTESTNLALQGVAKAHPAKKKIIISTLEHAATSELATWFSMEGYRIVRLPVTREGTINLKELEAQLDGNTLVVSLMHANNILGTLTNITAVGALCAKKRVLFHVDAAQSFGKVPIDVRSMHIDLLSASAQKLGGPKGAGLLYVRNGITVSPLFLGGGQERGLRPGTENVPGIVGFAAAIKRGPSEKKLKAIRAAFVKGLEGLGGQVNGSSHGLPSIVHVSFPHVDGEQIVMRLSHAGIYVSTQSACESRGPREDSVLKAIGLFPSLITGSFRISFDETISMKDVTRVITTLKKILPLCRV